MSMAAEEILELLCATVEHEPVDWYRFDELLKAVEDINVFYEDEEETLLTKFINYVNFYKNGINMPAAIQHFIDNGYDVSANSSINGALCLSSLCWSSYDEYVIKASKVLLNAGASIEYTCPDDEPDEATEVIESIKWKLSGAWAVDKDYSWTNILEPYYALIKAVEEGKDDTSISSYHDCIGKQLTSTGVIGELPRLSPRMTRTDFAGQIVFYFDDLPLVINAYMEMVINPVLVQDKADVVVNVDEMFKKITRHALISVKYANESMFFFDFDNGVRIIFVSLPIEKKSALELLRSRKPRM